jgi:hypothetical protein
VWAFIEPFIRQDRSSLSLSLSMPITSHHRHPLSIERCVKHKMCDSMSDIYVCIETPSHTWMDRSKTDWCRSSIFSTLQIRTIDSRVLLPGPVCSMHAPTHDDNSPTPTQLPTAHSTLAAFMAYLCLCGLSSTPTLQPAKNTIYRQYAVQ